MGEKAMKNDHNRLTEGDIDIVTPTLKGGPLLSKK
jgi:hypothetical protein